MRHHSGYAAIACGCLIALTFSGTAHASKGVEHILQARIVARDPDNVWGGRTARCSAKANIVDQGGDAGMDPGLDVGPTEFGTFTMPSSNDPAAREASSPGAATFYADKECHSGNHLRATLKEFSCSFVGTNGKGDDSPQNKIHGTPDPNAEQPKGAPKHAQPGETQWLQPQTPPKIDSPPPASDFDNPNGTGDAKREQGKGYRWGNGTVTIDFFWSSHKCDLPPPKKKKKKGDDEDDDSQTPPPVKKDTGTTGTQEKPGTGHPKKHTRHHLHGKITEDNPGYMENYTPPTVTHTKPASGDTDTGGAPPPPQGDQNTTQPNNDYNHAPDIPNPN